MATQTDHLLSDIKQKEARMQEIRELRMHIINCSKTRDIYTSRRTRTMPSIAPSGNG